MTDDYHPLKTHSQKYISIESIFQWKPVVKKENIHKYEYEPQKEDVFNFFNFALRLVKCYHIHEEDLNSAMDIISDLESEALIWSKTKTEDLFAKCKDAFIHILFASKVALLGIKKNSQQIFKTMDKITPIDEMDQFNKAAIFATRSTVLVLCSDEGIDKAIVFIDKALNLDPDNAQWISLKAFYLRKLRENINPIEPPSMMEKELFESAYKKEPTNVVYKLQVADLYLDLSDHIMRQPTDRNDYVFPGKISLYDHTQFEADSKISKALQYYESASGKYPENTYVLVNCARGFLKIPAPHRDVELARSLLTEALKKNPKSIRGHLTMAHLLEEYDDNIKKAKSHLETCQKLKSFEGDLAMIRIIHRHHNAEDTAAFGYKALQAIAEKHTEKLQLAVIYSQLVSFYLFVKYDLIKACHYTEKFYKLDSASSCMKLHRSLFFDYPTPFSLVNVLMDEIKYKKRTPRSPETIRQICEDFEIFMCYQNVPIVNGFPQNLRWRILQGKPVENDTVPDKNTRPVGNNEPRRYENNRDQPNNRANGGRLYRSESMNDFYPSQNGNKRYSPQEKRYNNNDNYRNDTTTKTNQRPKLPLEESTNTNEPYRNNTLASRNYLTRSSSVEPTYPSHTTAPITEKSSTERNSPVAKADNKPKKKEKSPSRPSPPPVIDEGSENGSSSDSDFLDEKLIREVLKTLKKLKQTREKKSKKSKHAKNDSNSESEDTSKSAREKKSKKSKHRKPSFSSESDNDTKPSREVERKQHSRRYYSESDTESTDRDEKDHYKEYSKKKYHSHVDSSYPVAEKKSRDKRRDSPPPRSERDKTRSGYESARDKRHERRSSKYERSESDNENQFDRTKGKSKRTSSRYH